MRVKGNRGRKGVRAGRRNDAGTAKRKLAALVLAAREARATEKLLRALVERTPAAVAMLDRDLRYIITSRRWLTDYKLTQRNIIGKHHYEIFPEARRWRRDHQRCLAGKVIRSEEDSFVRPDGRRDWLRWEICPWRDSSGKVGGIIMFTEVITDQVEAKERLRDSEAHLAQAQRLAKVGSFEFEEPGGKSTWSRECFRITGRSERLGEPTAEQYLRVVVHPDDRDFVRRCVAVDAIRRKKTFDFEHRIVTPRGKVKWLHAVGQPVTDRRGRVVKVFGTIMDITARKVAEEAFEESQARLKEAQRMSRIGHWELDARTKQMTWSEEMFRLYQMEPAARTPRFAEVVKFYGPADARRIRTAIHRAIAEGKPFTMDVETLPLRGRKAYHLGIIQPVVGRGGTVLKVRGTVQDITERKKAEVELAAARAQLETRVEQRTVQLELATQHLQREIQFRVRAELAARDAYRKLNHAREEERERLARDLHDGLGQRLTGLTLDLQALLARRPSGLDRTARQLLARSKEKCRHLIGEVRAISHDLFPPSLEALGLAASLEQLATGPRRKFHVRVRIDRELEGVRFDPQTEIALFRIAQESVANAQRHSRGRRVWVSLCRMGQRLMLKVEDDGVGFDFKKIYKPSMGMVGMRERAMEVGGKVVFVRRHGRTCLEAVLPMPAPRAAE